MQNRHCRKKGKDTTHSDRHGADKFGDLITADTFFSYDGLSEDGDVFGIVVCDAYIGWLACYPAAEKRTEEAHFALNDFVGPKEKVCIFYSDCALELVGAANKARVAPCYLNARPPGSRWHCRANSSCSPRRRAMPLLVFLTDGGIMQLGIGVSCTM